MEARPFFKSTGVQTIRTCWQPCAIFTGYTTIRSATWDHSKSHLRKPCWYASPLQAEQASINRLQYYQLLCPSYAIPPEYCGFTSSAALILNRSLWSAAKRLSLENREVRSFGFCPRPHNFRHLKMQTCEQHVVPACCTGCVLYRLDLDHGHRKRTVKCLPWCQQPFSTCRNQHANL